VLSRLATGISDGTRPGVGLYVIALTGHRISALIRFEGSVLPWFGLPPSLPGGSQIPVKTMSLRSCFRF